MQPYAVHQAGSALQYAAADLQDDRDVVMAALRQDTEPSRTAPRNPGPLALTLALTLAL